MRSPRLLVEALRDAMRQTAQFMTYMNNNPENVKAYQDDWAGVAQALVSMTAPGALVVWQSLEEVAEGQSAWTHRVDIYVRIRPGDVMEDVLHSLTNGIPTGGHQRLLGVDSPDQYRYWELLGLPSAVRDLDEANAEYLSVSLRYRQKGED